jgi:hypothetical protein
LSCDKERRTRALLVAAGLGPSAEHALISLLALNGLRVSEATGADIQFRRSGTRRRRLSTCCATWPTQPTPRSS